MKYSSSKAQACMYCVHTVLCTCTVFPDALSPGAVLDKDVGN